MSATVLTERQQKVLELLKPVLSALAVAEVLQEARGTLTVIVNNVKASFFEYTYPLLRPHLVTNGIPVAHIEDIAAMKVSAIAGRGSRKDFVDLFFVTRHGYSVADLLSLFQEKFAGIKVDRYHLMRSLIYFDDAEREESPELLVPVHWEEIKNYFRQEIQNLTR